MNKFTKVISIQKEFLAINKRMAAFKKLSYIEYSRLKLSKKVASSDWKIYIGQIWDGTKVYKVNGKYVRDNYDTYWVAGGNGFAYKFIPKDQIWIEKLEDLQDTQMNLLHELFEYHFVKYLHLKYIPAHDRTTTIERVVRKLDDDVEKKVNEKKQPIDAARSQV